MMVEQALHIAADPARIWNLVSTGDGISSWFVEAQVSPGPAGAVTLRFGPAAVGVMPIQRWDPPNGLRFGSPEGKGRVHEFEVTASPSGGALVRVRDWGLDDAEAVGARGAWAGYLRRLKDRAEENRP